MVALHKWVFLLLLLQHSLTRSTWKGGGLLLVSLLRRHTAPLSSVLEVFCSKSPNRLHCHKHFHDILIQCERSPDWIESTDTGTSQLRGLHWVCLIGWHHAVIYICKLYSRFAIQLHCCCPLVMSLTATQHNYTTTLLNDALCVQYFRGVRFHQISDSRQWFRLLICILIDTGKAAPEAVEKALQYMGERVQGGGGAIAVCPSGEWAAKFTTERMAWACVDGEALHYGLNPREDFKETLWGTSVHTS